MISDEPLTQAELSHRWKVPVGTLRNWRYTGKGPTFLKLGKHISYRIKDIEEFEEKKSRKNTCKVL